jgi:GR25 family glycosyltransferase involved in LPS biosynthesis
MIQNELQMFEREKVIRLEATLHENGLIGCVESHINALQLAMDNQWPNVLIVEDDLKFVNIEESTANFLHLVNETNDVILLGSTFPTITKSQKLVQGQTTTAYFVKQH